MISKHMQDIQKQLEMMQVLIKEFSDNIEMKFGLDKCAFIHIESGKIEI